MSKDIDTFQQELDFILKKRLNNFSKNEFPILKQKIEISLEAKAFLQAKFAISGKYKDGIDIFNYFKINNERYYEYVYFCATEFKCMIRNPRKIKYMDSKLNKHIIHHPKANFFFKFQKTSFPIIKHF